jgi:hypothetical protein
MSHCHITHGQRYDTILSGHLTSIAVSHEWSTGSTLHCSRMSACLAGLNGAACPHVSHALIA